MNNFYIYNLQNRIKMLPMKEVKGIVLDSYNPPLSYKNEEGKDVLITDDTIIPYYIKNNLSFNKGNVLYNYMIDKAGNIHELFPINCAAQCCIFPEYSYEATRLFPDSCGERHFLNSQDKITLDQEVVSICTITNTTEYIQDTGQMTSECYKSLNKLIEYIICKLTNEYETVIYSNSIFLRCIFPTNNKFIGHMFFKRNIGQLFVLTRDITHSTGISRHMKDYRTMFNFIAI
jgi:hypothetical protein